MTHDLTKLLAVAEEAVDHARALLLDRHPGPITAKGDRDLATELDYRVERDVRGFLEARSPGIAFLGEEEGSRGERAELTWALDPIDGTVNFVHGMPLCGTSLGLMRGDVPVLGVIDLPFLGSRYTAAHDRGAFANGRPIHVSTTAALGEAVVALGDYAVGADHAAKNQARFAITTLLAEHVQRVRMFGSAAIDLAWVASGVVDASIMLANRTWDTAAGVVIAREAGAQIVDVDGSEHTVKSRATIAGPPALVPQILELIHTAEPTLIAEAANG